MTFDEFLGMRPEIATADQIEQFFAVAWFLSRHKSKPRFTLKEMEELMKEAGLDYWPAGRLVVRFCANTDKRLMNFVDGKTHTYALMRHVVDALDEKYKECLRSPTSTAASNAVAELPKQFPALNGCPYWQELMLCYSSNALRATVIMAWNLIYNRLCEYILADAGRLADFNLKAYKPVSTRDDFTEFREFDVINWSKNSGIIISNVQAILLEKLRRRNMFAHASGIIPIPHDVDTFILDVITNVLPRLV